MLFVLSMEVLNALILQAEEEQLFLPLGNSGIIFRASFYADDTVIFIKPARQDLLLLLSIMEAFEQISGLRTNKEKSKATPINCSAEETLSLFLVVPLSINTSGSHMLTIVDESVEVCMRNRTVTQNARDND